MSNGQSFRMVRVTLHVTCHLKFEITIPWASTPVENKTRLYNTHTLYCIMIYCVILYIYYIDIHTYTESIHAYVDCIQNISWMVIFHIKNHEQNPKSPTDRRRPLFLLRRGGAHWSGGPPSAFEVGAERTCSHIFIPRFQVISAMITKQKQTSILSKKTFY